MCNILKLIIYLFQLFVLSSCSYSEKSESKSNIDENGYILFCPCMGRFGNQADQFLGVLSFARGLNRTLVLPPWIEYVPGAAESVQIPFDKYFQVAPLQRFHKVILMHDFMRDIATTIWPEEKRIVLCYTARYNSDGCNAKHGNPFGPFWDHFGVDFINSSFYKHLSYDVSYGNHAARWHESYPSKDWPVLAFTGAPSSFPVQKENVHLHQYLQWSESLHKKAKELIKTFPRGPFVGIHLRNGLDWERACELIEQSPNMFAAPQCLGYMNEKGKATAELCLPSTDTIIKQLKRAIKRVKAKNVFVASDKHYMKDELTHALSKMKINVLTSDGSSPHLDLAVLGLSNHFIGNCISSFSAFVKRERDVMGFPSSFWAFPLVKPKKNSHGEL